mmetsp:Transcript_45778/g.122714  ORF Transcript_45778/g.122714 Transcript_45778/m.122714 type:complete len:223 (+) Transcript_45778:138-806(+)
MPRGPRQHLQTAAPRTSQQRLASVCDEHELALVRLGLLCRRLGGPCRVLAGDGVLLVGVGDDLLDEVHGRRRAVGHEGQREAAALQQHHEELHGELRRDRGLRAALRGFAEVSDGTVDPYAREVSKAHGARSRSILAASINRVPNLLLDLRAGDDLRHHLGEDRAEAILFEGPVVGGKHQRFEIQLCDGQDQVARKIILDACIQDQQKVDLALGEPLSLAQA